MSELYTPPHNRGSRSVRLRRQRRTGQPDARQLPEPADLALNDAGKRLVYAYYNGQSSPSLVEQFAYRNGQIAQVITTGTSPYTDTYLYRQDGAPYELIRKQGSQTNDYFYVTDRQHSVLAVVNTSGVVEDSYTYDSWGKLTSASEQVPQRLRYAGYWYDQEFGWYWVTNRWYDPGLERFLQPDPANAGGLFEYAYANDDAVDHTDPSGLASCPLNEAEYYGQCSPIWTSPGTQLLYPNGSCWPDPGNCVGDVASNNAWDAAYVQKFGYLRIVSAGQADASVDEQCGIGLIEAGRGPWPGWVRWKLIVDSFIGAIEAIFYRLKFINVTTGAT